MIELNCEQIWLESREEERKQSAWAAAAADKKSESALARSPRDCLKDKFGRAPALLAVK